MYVDPNYKTKKELKAAVAEGKLDKSNFYQPAGLGPDAPDNGKVYVEGPHSPEPHRWYAQVILQDGKPVKVL